MKKDEPEVCNFVRAWPEKNEKPVVNLKFTKSTIIITTENGLSFDSFYVSFETNTNVGKVRVTVTPFNLEGPKIILCNGLKNGFKMEKEENKA